MKFSRRGLFDGFRKRSESVLVSRDESVVLPEEEKESLGGGVNRRFFLFGMLAAPVVVYAAPKLFELDSSAGRLIREAATPHIVGEASLADVIAAQFEYLRPKLLHLFENSETIGRLAVADVRRQHGFYEGRNYDGPLDKRHAPQRKNRARVLAV